jgi:hypothetical protein
MSDSEVFIGFDTTKTTPVPDELFDELLTVLKWDELKVMLYIIRRTRGFQKVEDTISLSQFTDGITTDDGRILDSGCGIKNRTRVSKILKQLEKDGYIDIIRPKAKTGLITYRLHCKKANDDSARDATVPSTGDATVPIHADTRDATVPSTVDDSVPSTRYATVPHNRQLTTNSKQETDNVRTNEPSPSSSFSSSEKETKSSVWTPEEDTLLSWLRADNPREGKELKKHLQKMLPHVTTSEKAHDLFLHTQKLIMASSKRSDKVVSIGNMVEDWIFNGWLQAQKQEPVEEQAPAPDAQVGIEQCEEPQPVDKPVSPGRDRGMLQGYANDLAARIMADMPDAIVEVRPWNGALYRVNVTIAGEEMEFAESWRYDNWRAEQMQVAV